MLGAIVGDIVGSVYEFDNHKSEEAIRKAISIGGDSDTLAAITGSIAEAKWGVPEWARRITHRRCQRSYVM